MIVTTVYNSANAVITGCYYTAKGDKIDVEYMGSALECECYINGVRQDNEGSNEVQSVVNHTGNHWVSEAPTGFPLHSVWSSVVAVQGA